MLAFPSGPSLAQSDPDALDELLDRTGARIGEFWDEYREVTATEEVRRQRRTPDGELVSERVQTFDYLIVMQLSGSDLIVDESRIDQTGAPAEDSGEPFLVTNGFSTLLLVFHPYFRNSFRYELAAGSSTGSPDDALARVDFAAIRGRRSPAVLRLEGREYPIQWKGSAWIDRRSGMVTRIETALGEPMADLGLLSLAARTDYEAVTLGESEVDHWLPSSTIIEASSEHQRWRNEHRFAGYRLFQVDTGVEVVDSGPVGGERRGP